MMILSGMRQHGDQYDGSEILDPDSGLRLQEHHAAEKRGTGAGRSRLPRRIGLRVVPDLDSRSEEP
jgi:hypothetical protein